MLVDDKIYLGTSTRPEYLAVLTERAKRKQEEEARQRMEDERLKAERATYRDAPRRSTRQTPVEAAVSSFTRPVASRHVSALVRGILGSLKRGR